MNTISGPMLGAISTYLLEADRDRDVRCIVLTGVRAGVLRRARPGGAGEDEDAAGSATSGRPSGGAGEFDMRDAPPTVLHNVDTPTICALNGGAAGYGLDLALGCDIRIAAASAKLAPGFAKRGILPESGGTWLLPRMIGYAKAAEIAFRGNTLTAAESLRAGHRQPRRPRRRVPRRSRPQVAGEIAANAPLAVRAIKRMMRAAETETFEQNVHHVFLQLLPLLGTNDFKRGRRRVHGEAAGGVHRVVSDGGRSRHRAARGAGDDARHPPLPADPIPDDDLAEILWYAQRRRRARTGSGSASSRCVATTRRPRRRASC